MSNASEPFEPLISHWNALRRPSARRVALDRAHRAVLELDGGLEHVVNRPSLDERLHEPRDRGDLTVQEPAEVDHVSADVPQCA